MQHFKIWSEQKMKFWGSWRNLKLPASTGCSESPALCLVDLVLLISSIKTSQKCQPVTTAFPRSYSFGYLLGSQKALPSQDRFLLRGSLCGGTSSAALLTWPQSTRIKGIAITLNLRQTWRKFLTFILTQSKISVFHQQRYFIKIYEYNYNIN